MKFIIVEITNENDTLEANISASDSGLQLSKPSYHLILGPAPHGDIVLTPQELLRRIGFAVADQLKDSEEMIRRDAEGARSLMLALEEVGADALAMDVYLDLDTGALRGRVGITTSTPEPRGRHAYASVGHVSGSPGTSLPYRITLVK
jgi:hypothetical protein